MTLTPAVVEGFRLLAAGRLAEAEAVARARLAEAPADAGAWHLAGVLHAKNARAATACEALERAASLAPADARVRLDL
ncbi:MAG TPA: hypothetical protein VFX50_01555, partial [Gemmatimonadales bacterium]|nr:hypothetical protein [Gemmatimonadales bacterium]